MIKNGPMVHNQHTVQNYAMPQNQPNVQYHVNVQNFGCALPAAPNQQEAVVNNAAPRTQHQRQTRGIVQQTQATNQIQPPANFQPMAQAAQPAQPANRWLSNAKDVKQVAGWLEEKGDDFGDQIQDFQDLARYREAERRTKLVWTPSLAGDFPASKTQQRPLARRLFRAFKVWREGTRGWTRQAINKVALQNKFIVQLTAWKLLVRYLLKPQSLFKANIC